MELLALQDTQRTALQMVAGSLLEKEKSSQMRLCAQPGTLMSGLQPHLKAVSRTSAAAADGLYSWHINIIVPHMRVVRMNLSTCDRSSQHLWFSFLHPLG